MKLAISTLPALALLISAAHAGSPARPKSWVFLAPTPYAVSSAAAAYDPARDRIVLFGGINAFCGTWEFDGAAWSCISSSAPETLVAPRMTFDPNQQRVLLYGGRSTPFLTSAMRAWNGASWQSFVTPNPPDRFMHTMTWDDARNRAVVIGGQAASATGILSSTTWEWSGAAWSSTPPLSAPPERYAASMAYDASRQRTVLYGGQDFSQPLTDTWERSGNTWTHIPVSPPPQAVNAAMTYAAARERIIIHGGTLPQGGFINQTWMYDGAAWALLTDKGPQAALTILTYDSTRRRSILLAYGPGQNAGTWALPDCPGDANADGAVNFADLNHILSGYGAPASLGQPGDLDGDGAITFTDLNQVLSSFGATGC